MNEHFYNGFVKRAKEQLSEPDFDALNEASQYVKFLHTEGLTDKEFNKIHKEVLKNILFRAEVVKGISESPGASLLLGSGSSLPEDVSDEARAFLPKSKKDSVYDPGLVWEIKNIGKPPWYRRLIGEKPINSQATLLTKFPTGDSDRAKHLNTYVVTNRPQVPKWFVDRLIGHATKDSMPGSIYVNDANSVYTQ